MAVTISPRSTAPQLSRYVTEMPQIIAVQQERKAALYSLASKVSFIGLIAIWSVILSISIGILLPLHPALTFALVLSTISLPVCFQTFVVRALESSRVAREAQDRADELALIQHWKSPQIEAFFKEHNLSFEKLPMDLLRRLDPKEPLRALLPAIASYNYFCHTSEKHLKEHDENLHNSLENQTLHYEGRRMGWHKLEFEAIPAAFQAALVLQTISQPTLRLKLDDLGTCCMKEFDQRRFDQLLDGTDEYFVFKDQSPALNFTAAQEMVTKQDIDGLRVKLFSEERISRRKVENLTRRLHRICGWTLSMTMTRVRTRILR
jgi:hypothetical protein